MKTAWWRFFVVAMVLFGAIVAQAADVTPPSVSSVTPASGADNVWLDSDVKAVFSEAMAAGSINSTTFVLREGLVSIDGDLAYDEVEKTLTFTPYAPFELGVTYNAMVTADVQDGAGNRMGQVFAWSFTTTTRTSTPFVLYVTPGDGDTGIKPNVVLAADFSEAMEPDTIDSTSFVVATDLADIAGTRVSGTILYDALYRQVTFTPDNDLTANTEYFGLLTTSVKSWGGVALPADYSWSFTTNNHSHTITTTWATTGADPDVWLTGPISVTFSEPMMPTTINTDTFTLKQGATPVSGTVYYNSILKKATFIPSAPLTSGLTYTAELSDQVYCTQGVSLAGGDSLTFDTTSDVTAPAVSSTTPDAGATNVWVDATISVVFDSSMSASSLNSTTFILKKGATKIAADTIAYTDGTKTAVFTPAASLLTNTLYTVVLTTGVKDANGNKLAAQKVWTFRTTTDSTEPTITGRSPADTTTDVSITAPVVVTFSEEMDPATLDETSVILHTDPLDIEATAIAVAVTIDAESKIVTLKPSSPLAYNTDYYVLVPQLPVPAWVGAISVKDASGNGLTGDDSWSFTTTNDQIAPTTLNADPVDEATDIWRNATVSIEFDKPMDASTITSTSFSLDNGAVGTVAYDAGSKVATFTPTGALTANTTYIVTLSTAITDSKGNPLAAPVTWNFDTTADVTPAVATLTTPLDGATGVPLLSAIDIHFDDDMTGSTITDVSIVLSSAELEAQIPGTVTYAAGAGEGTATFTPDSPLVTDTTYEVTVGAGVKDDAGNATALTSFSFSTTSDGVQPSVLSFTPAADATNVWLDTAVTVTFSEDVDSATLDDATTFTLTESGTPVAGTITYLANTATYTPSSALTKNKTYVVTLTTGVKDPAGNALSSGVSFSFTTMNDNTNPTASTLTPATGVVLDPTVSVIFSEQMASSTITTTSVYLCETASPGVHLAATVSYDAVFKTAMIFPTDLLTSNTSYDINVTTAAKDSNGLPLTSAFKASFTTVTDAGAPTVASVSPVENSVTAWPGAVVTVTFSENVRSSTVNSTSLSLIDSNEDPVAGTVAYNASTFTASFTPNASLALGETYSAKITDLVTDISGRAMAADKVWSFTVSTDTTAPTVTVVTPAASSSNVWTDSVVTATFNEEIASSTLTTTTFTLKAGVTPVAGVVTYDDVNDVVTFTPSADLALNTLFTATLTTGVKDLGGNALASSKVWTFTTTADGAAPTVAGTFPANAATGVSILEVPSVTFSEAMLSSTLTTANFTLDCGGAVAGSVAYNSVTRTATLTPSAPLDYDADCTATVKGDVSDLGGNLLGSDHVWTFKVSNDQVAPSVTALAPAPAEYSGTIWQSAVFTATFSKAMTVSTIDSANLNLKVKSSGLAVPGAVTYSTSLNRATFTPSALLDLSEVYTLTVTTGVRDASGNALASAETLDVTVTDDATAPTVLSTVPAADATGVWRDSTVTVTFSENVRAATATTSTVFLKNGETPVAATVNAANAVVTITPTAALAANTVYTVNVTTGLKDRNGNALANAFTYSFTTTADVVEPAVTSYSPASGATGVSRKPVVSVVFSEPLTASTVNASTLLLNDGAVAGSVTYDAATKTAKIVPTNLLATSTVYTVKVSKNIKDLNGNAMTTDGTWTFTTTNDGTQPTMTGFSPADLSSGIWPNTAVTATFSKAIDQSSITSTTFNLKVKATSKAVTGTITYDATSRTARLTPASALLRNTTYTATVTTGIVDSVGNALSAGGTWEFTTTSDAVAPTITSVTPDVSATSVWSDAVVSAVFSEALEPTTVSGAVFTLKDGSTPVDGAIALSDGNSKITFTPAAALLLNKVYTATVSTGVKDTGGNALATSKVWNFTTTSDTVMPSVVSTSPANAAVSVSKLAAPTITFSESMTGSTISATTLKLDKAGDVAGTVAYDAPSRTATFTPDAPLAIGGVYTLTAKADMRDLGGNKMTADKVISFTVTTDVDAPLVSEKFPLDAENDAWRATTVKATFNEAMTASSITGSTFTLKQGATPIAGTVAYDAGTMTAIFTPGSLLAANTTYTVNVVASVLDAGGNALGTPGDDDVGWTFKTTSDATAPTVTSTVPAAAATGVWRTGAPVKAVFSEPMTSATITTATFYLMQGTSLVAGSVSYDVDTRTASFAPTSALALNTAYNAYVTTGVKDKNGNAMAAIKTWSFTTTTDSAAPSVSSTSPVLGAAGVSRMPALNMVFSEAMSSSTLSSTFTLKKGVTDQPVAFSYNTTTRTATYTPTSTLDANTVYTATLTTGARDAAGNQLPADYSWTFTTTADVTAPTVTSTNPADLSIDNSTLAGVNAYFSEAMTGSTLTTSSYTLTRTDTDPDVAVVGTVVYNSTSNYVQFKPSAFLAKNATYLARMTTAVRDASGLPLAGEKTWSFTTSNDSTAPTVSSTSPAASATNVWQSAVVKATFNEAMHSSTITSTTFVVKLGTTTVPGVVTYEAATKSAVFTPTSPLTRGAVYTATVYNTVKDFAGNNMAASKVWSFTVTTDSVLPTVTAVSPISLATSVNRATTLTATFSEAMSSTSMTTTTFSLKKGTTVIPGAVTYNTTTRVATFTPTAILASGSSFTATLNGVKDANGNPLTAAYTWTFTTTTDAVPPTVTSKSPATGATLVSRKPTISVVFSEAMTSTTLTTTTCTLKTAAPGNVSAAVTLAYNSTTRTLTLVPTSLLDASQEYTVALSSSIRDANGNPLGALSWNFTTTDDEIAPTVSTITPAAAATGVSRLASVVVVFNDAMQASTLTTTNFNLKAGTTTVASTVTYDAATKTATLKPNSQLAANTVYTATLTTGVTDDAGNSLALYTSTFTTSTDVTTPTVLSVYPTAGATGISMLAPVYANFSEPMAESTFTTTTFTLKQGTTVIPGAVTYSGEPLRRAILRPTAQLSRNTLYTATVTTSVRDAAGNALTTAKTWSFTTTTDSLAPTLISMSPAADVGGVDVSSTVVVTFSEAMTTTTQTGVTLNLGVDPVTVTYAWDVAKKVLTLTPGADLTEGGRYTVGVTSAVKDLAGNSLDDFSWDFVVAPGTYIEPVTGVEFVWVNPGSFDMGDTFQTGEADESPAHAVSVTKGFWIAKYELTQDQWESVMGSNPSYFSTANGFPACPNCPVETVSFESVQSYLAQVATLSGKNIDLPTEAQWEYAARGGSNGAGFQYAGDDSPDLIGVYDTTATGEVGSLYQNELDIYDMSGNVWEMCSDWYSATEYTADTVTDPSGPAEGAERVTRGGAWDGPATELRVTNRYSVTESATSENLGVRLVLKP